MPARGVQARMRGQSRQQAHMQPPSALTLAPTTHRQAAGGTTGLPDSFVKARLRCRASWSVLVLEMTWHNTHT